MTGLLDQEDQGQTGPDLPSTLADYADRLLLGTDLEAADALLIASGQLDPPADLSRLANALHAGWMTGDLA
jgi:hypothetical protein